MRSFDRTGVADTIRAAGGALYGITSEPQALASEAENEWRLPFSVIGDPHHEIRNLCAQNKWLEIFFNPDDGHLGSRSWVSHIKGYYQPATLAIHKSGRILYRWRCVPKFSNLSGAGARPEAKHVWSIIKANIGKSHDAEIDKKPKMAYKELSWFQFLINGSAHGWFLIPKMFPLARQGDTPSANPSRMGGRVATFIALWSALFLMLPVGWSSTLLGLWLAIYVPGLIRLHNTFQNEPDDY